MSNGNTARNFRSSDYTRASNDWYVEPRWCVEQLADTIDFDSCLIWDPACGMGTIPYAFAGRGLDVVGSDIVDRGFEGCFAPHDFLLDDPRLVASGRYAIVTNPPFKQAEQFVRRALATPAVRVAIIQQLSFLASRTRHTLFDKFPPSDVLIVSKRPSMPPGHLIAELGDRAFRSGTTDYCWILWTRPHDRETRIRWLAPLMPQSAPTLL